MFAETLIATCPHCGRKMKASPEQVGRRARCNGCQQVFQISDAAIASVESAGATAPGSESAHGESATAASPQTVLGEAAATESETLAVSRSIAGATSIASSQPIAAGPDSVDIAELATTEQAAAEPAAEGRLGRFVVRQLLGQGAFGRVYRAHDPQLDRFVALKVPIFGSHDKEKIQRFLTEARSAARLRHPNIVPTYESGQDGGRYFIASQFVPGQPLAQRLRENPPDFRQAADWIRQLAGALAYAHGEGIIHRDIKPDNVMLDEKDVAQIMDFGLAKRLNEDSGMTADGSILGTPAYMSPEQARGDVAHIGPASDQYSLGVVLYEMLTGRRPFDGPPHSLLTQVLKDEPPAPRMLRRDVPADLEAICLKAMNKQPARRYATAADLANDLNRWMCGEVTVARPISAAERALRWGRRNLIALALAGMFLLATALAAAVAVLLPGSRGNLLQSNAAVLAATSDAAVAPPPPPPYLEPDVDNQAAKSPSEIHPAAPAPETQPQTAAPSPTVPAEAGQAKPPLPMIAPSPTDADEELVKVRAEADTNYRRQLATARRVWQEDPKQAEAELVKAESERRGWEWRYWMAQVRHHNVVSFARTPDRAQVKWLRFSPDGHSILAGGGRHINDRQEPWSGIYLLSGAKHVWLELEPPDAIGGDCLGAFSSDGERVLTVHREPRASRSRLSAWEWKNQLLPPVFLKTIDVGGFVLDCGQNAQAEWLVLAAALEPPDAENRYKLKPPLTVYNINARQDRAVACEAFYAAGFSADMKLLHVLARQGEQTCWLTSDLETQREQTRPIGPPLLATEPWAGENGGNVAAWRPGSLRSAAFAGGAFDSTGGFAIVNGKWLPELRLPSGPIAVAFDRDERRLLVARGDLGSLEIYDPNSPNPSVSFPPPALLGPAGSDAAAPVIELSPDSDQLAVAIGDTLTLFELSSSR